MHPANRSFSIPLIKNPATATPKPRLAGSSRDALLAVLGDPKSRKVDIQIVINEHFNPETFKESEVLIGDLEAKCSLESAYALEEFLSHLFTYGFFFPRIRFVNCSFSPECHSILVRCLGECLQLKSLTFEKCYLADKQLSEIISPLCLLNDNLEELAIIHNRFKFKSDTIESLEVLLQLNSALSHVNLSHNGLEDDAVVTIANALTDNHRLHTLRLDANRLTHSGGAALANWIKSHPAVRTCSLVHSIGHADDQKKLEQLVGRNPSPFVFDAAPPAALPAQFPHAAFQTMIAKADRYTEAQLDIIKKISLSSEKTTLFRQWLKIAFEIIDFGPDDHAQSFFKAISRACGKQEWMQCDTLFHASIAYIVGHIDEFTLPILTDFPKMPDGMHLGMFFEEQVIKNGTWPENTFKLAIQRILKLHQINRPVYIFSASIPPVVTAEGELLPHADFRLEENGMKASDAICLYFDGNSKFSLLEKKERRHPS